MKKIKFLILFMMLSCLCSFTNKAAVPYDFIIDYNIDLYAEITSYSTTELTFDYGQDFIIVEPYDVVGEPSELKISLVPMKNTTDQYVLTISDSSDIKKLNDVSTYFEISNSTPYCIVPINALSGPVDSMYYGMGAVCDLAFGIVVTDMEGADRVDSFLTKVFLSNAKAFAKPRIPIDTYKPVLNNHHGAFVTNVNNPITEAEIRTHIKAYDDVDGDLTSSIVCSVDNYSKNMHVVGTHSITYTVSDAAKNTATLTIHVQVKDSDAPVFSGKTEVTSNLSNPLTYDQVKALVTVSDNYDKNLTIIDNDKNDLQNNLNKVGDYVVEFSCTDSSGNKSIHNLKVMVRDNVAPIISGNSAYRTSPKKQILEKDIIAGLNIKDNHDTLTKDTIKKVRDSYTINYNRIGTYEMAFNILDKSGNCSETFVVTIIVEDKELPTFYVDKFIINCDPSVTLSNEDIFGILKQCNTIDFTKISDPDKQIVLTYDNYKNKMEEGQYNMGFKVSYDDGEVYDLTLIINKEIFAPITLPWYSRVYYSIVHYSIVINDYVSNLFQSIRNFFYELFH